MRRAAGPALVLIVLTAALVLLHFELKDFHFRNVKASLQAIPAWKLAACLGLTALNYLILLGYDVIAVRATGHPLLLRRIALASFAGFAVSYNFGAIFGGTPVRARLYSSWGLSAAEIVQLIVALGTTFWVGVFALAGLVFVVDPFPIPGPVPLPVADVRPIGVGLLIVAAAYLALPLVWKKPLVWRGHELVIPRFPVLASQLTVSAADLTVAAASLYVILPPSLTLSYSQFLGVYLLAVIAVVFTHVPGGLGILELIILTFAGAQAKEETLAALMAFRVIYYLIPLGLAFALLLGHEWWLHREEARTLARRAGVLLGGLTPTVVSLGTMLAGALLLLSSSAPALSERFHHLHWWVPRALVEASHFLASLAGAGMLLLGVGLQRRLDSAWWAATALVTAGIIFSLVKGPNYVEAVALLLVMTALAAARRRFYRKGSVLHAAWTSGWIAAVGIVVLCSVWLGIFAHQHHLARDESWWAFEFDTEISRFQRAQIGVIVVVLGFAMARLLTGRAQVKHTPADSAELEQAAVIVAASKRTSASLALLGDKALLFNEARTAFIMYGIQGRTWVSMGDPVGPDEEWDELVWEFREECDRYDAWPVFYQVGPERLTLYLDQGYSLLKLGEEARVDVPQFTLEGGGRKGLRSNRNKLQKEGCTFEIVPREDVPALIPDLRAISDAWLGAKKGGEKGFSLGYFDEACLERFSCALVRHNGAPIAFANLWLAADREEFAPDLMRYRPDGPRGLMDYLFVEMLLWGQVEKYRWFNLGMAPLSGIEARKLSPLWNKMAALLYRHGDSFYGFEGLREYKEKFDPVWTPKYLATRGGLALPRILADVTALIGRKRLVDK